MAQKAKGKKKAKRTRTQEPRSGADKRKMKTSTKVIIVVFAVLMALTMMLPSFASVVASDRQAAEQEEQQSSDSSSSSDDSTSTDDSASADDSDSSDDSSATEGVPESLQSLAEQYSSTTASLESKLESDPNNLAALINLAQDYMNWGYQAISQSSTDEETSYSQGLLSKAIDYYDRYLALNDANSAKVDRALCLYYSGDTDGAKAALEQITSDAPDFAPAWANLGLMYEQEGDTDKATEAYQKASDSDPDDEYGAKSFAERRLIQIKAQESATSDDDDATSVISSDSSDSQGLNDALAEKSGVGL